MKTPLYISGQVKFASILGIAIIVYLITGSTGWSLGGALTVLLGITVLQVRSESRIPQSLMQFANMFLDTVELSDSSGFSHGYLDFPGGIRRFMAYKTTDDGMILLFNSEMVGICRWDRIAEIRSLEKDRVELRLVQLNEAVHATRKLVVSKPKRFWTSVPCELQPRDGEE